MKEKEMKLIASWILEVVDHEKNNKLPVEKADRVEFMKTFRANLPKDKFLKEISQKVKLLCSRFPLE